MMPTAPSRLRVCVLALCVLAGLSACNTNSTRNEDINVVDTTQALVQMITDAKTRTVLVDVRQPSAFAEGHLPGAINIPVTDMVANDYRLAQAKNIVVYSNGYQPNRRDVLSWAGATKLLTFGYSNVHDYRGGVALWQADGRQLAAGSDQ